MHAPVVSKFPENLSSSSTSPTLIGNNPPEDGDVYYHMDFHSPASPTNLFLKIKDLESSEINDLS